MPDREKVLKGLEYHLSSDDCRSCVYWDGVKSGRPCEVMEDALTLLKEQQAEIDEISDEYLDLGKEMAKQPEIVRCKDCKYYNSKPDSHGDRCDKIHWSRNDDWFCADGKRSE